MRRLSLLALTLISATAFAQTYRWTDPATGRTMVTDTPPPRTIQQVRKTSAGPADDGVQSVTVRRAAENFPVTLYTSADCTTECKNARDLLNRRGVPFTEKMIQKPEDFAELKALVGDAFVPSLKVGRQAQKGFDQEAYNNLLNLAGYPSTAPYGSRPSGGLPPTDRAEQTSSPEVR